MAQIFHEEFLLQIKVFTIGIVEVLFWQYGLVRDYTVTEARFEVELAVSPAAWMIILTKFSVEISELKVCYYLHCKVGCIQCTLYLKT